MAKRYMMQEEIVSLISKAQAGDDSARDELFLAHGKLVMSVARSVNLLNASIDYDDLYQVGCLALIKAIKTYDVTSAASFKTYASTCIYNAVLDEVRKHKGVPTEPLDELVPSDTPTSDDVEREYIEKETTSLLYNALRTTLSDLEFEVLNLYLIGLSYKEISDKLSVEKKKVDNTLTAIKHKAQEILSKNTPKA